MGKYNLNAAHAFDDPNFIVEYNAVASAANDLDTRAAALEAGVGASLGFTGAMRQQIKLNPAAWTLGGVNLCQSPDGVGWAITNAGSSGTFTPVSGTTIDGCQAASVAVSATGGSFEVISPRYPISTAGVITNCIRAMCTVATSIQMRIYAYDSSGTLLGNPGLNSPLALTANTPATGSRNTINAGTWASFAIGFYVSAPAVGTYYFNQATVYPGVVTATPCSGNLGLSSAATTRFDFFTGLANASTTQMVTKV